MNALSQAHAEPPTHAEPEAITALVDSLAPYSDGRVWCDELVTREIHLYTEQMVVCAYELGRRLLWTQGVLGTGRFEAWCTERLPFAARTAQNYMRVAEFLTHHPGLLKPLAQAGLKKVLLLTTLPDETVEEMIGDGHIAQVPLTELGDIPYVTLKKKLADEQAAHEDTARALRAAQEKLGSAQAIVTDLTARERSYADNAALEDLERAQDLFETAWSRLGPMLDGLARRMADRSPDVQAKTVGLLAYMTTRCSYEQLRFRSLSGGEVYGYEFDELLGAPRPAQDAFPIPGERMLDAFPDAGPADTDEEILRLYTEGQNVFQIAQRLGRTPASVRDVLIAANALCGGGGEA